MNFFQILVNIITRYGFFPGIVLFVKLKLKLFNGLKIPGVAYPLTMRRASSDHAVFLQLFVNEEYAFNYKGKINTIIDAGANAGYAAIYFANLFKGAKVICIEPAKDNYELLKINTSTIPNTHILLAAIWNKHVKMEVIDHGSQWVYSVKEDTSGALIGYSVSEIMGMFKLDTIDIFKIDIEGSEKELFEKGYDEWLPKTKYLIVETHDRVKKDCTKTLFKALENYNFSCHLNGENFIFVNKDIVN